MQKVDYIQRYELNWSSGQSTTAVERENLARILSDDEPLTVD